ncbi:hypothetical protein DSM21852_03080 [Methylocystis bryophila]|uniref:Serine protease n=2 Tax=Methylocystis bryophila TaxID=655015 RepID=A0A1W6MU90_9HYPH|nr:hypothetical protein B1812_08585 [Methylocystis bryophila]BDV37055.1 hypothetical protein DSM21852_03080 [Methylocystis bryophila]
MGRDNRFFVMSSDLTGRVALDVGGRRAISEYDGLVDRIERLCGREAATLFAEPVLPRGGAEPATAISWYGPFEGRPTTLDAIDAVAKKPTVDRLTQRLNALAPALGDPEFAPMLAAALAVDSIKDVLAVGGEPLIVNWGLLPQDAAQQPARRLAHFSDTLGRYAPALIPLVAQTLGLAPPPPTAAPPPPSPPPPPFAPPRRAAPTAPRGLPPPGWRTPLVAAAIAGAVLLVLLLPGVLRYPDLGDRAARDAFETERLRKSNDSLEAQLKALRKAQEERSCRADGMLQVPGLPPGESSQQPPQMDVLPRPPEKVPLPQRSGEAPSAANLAEMLEKATVFVFVITKDGWSSGSGFFINDRQVVTNRHVVENAADPSIIFLASKSFGGVRRASVVAETPPRVKNAGPQPDYAVLELAEPIPGAVALKLGATPPKLSTAYIAGYPGFLVETDAAFSKFLRELRDALKAGDDDRALAARRFDVPSADLRYGRINNTMSSGAGETPVIVHDMQVAHGNSGGPLVDACGRLGGVNTLFFADEHQVGNVALDVTSLKTFLTDKRIGFAGDDTPCASAPPASAAR